MVSEDRIEKQFKSLTNYLKYCAEIVKKIFAPEAFNYHFWYPPYKGHKLFKEGQVKTSYIRYKEIRKGEFIFPDGIYPIVGIGQSLDLYEYMRSNEKSKLWRHSVGLEVILGPEKLRRVWIYEDWSDKSFIKNWEKFFGYEAPLYFADKILFLVVKNGTLEIRDFSLSNDNKNENWEVKFYDKVKFGVDFLDHSVPFGISSLGSSYKLSKLFFDLIINFLWNNQEDDKGKILRAIKGLTKSLWTNGMFKSKIYFLHLNSILNSIDLEENKSLLMEIEKQKSLLDEMRTNPNLYLPILPKDAQQISYHDIIDGNANFRFGLYLITQYIRDTYGNDVIDTIVLKDPMKGTTVIYDVPDYWIWGVAINEEPYARFFGKDKAKWKIGLIYVWPVSGSSDTAISGADYFLTFLYIPLPFNPYIKHTSIEYDKQNDVKKGKNVMYVPDEISDLLIDKIFKVEPQIQKWIETQAMKDKEELYKWLENLLNELGAGEEYLDRIIREEIKTYESKSEIQKEKQQEIVEVRDEEKEQKFIKELKQEVEIHKEEEQKQLQTVEPENKEEPKIIEKIRKYLNSEDYKQELVFTLQKLLKEPEYKEFVEFVDEYYPRLIMRKNVPNEVKRKIEEYWSYDKELARQPLPEGIYLIIYKKYEKIPWHEHRHIAGFITRREVRESGKEKFYTLEIGKKYGTENMPYVVNGLIYFVYYKGQYYFLTTKLPTKLYTYLYCGTSEKVCIWMPEMVLKVIWPIFQKMAEKIKREVLSSVAEEPKQEQKEEKIFKAPELQIEEPKVEEKQEAKIDREQKETTEKPKRRKKKEEISEVQQKEQKDTTEKPKRKKKEEKISEQQQEQEKKEEKVEEEKVEEIKKQDIIEELEDADIEAKVKSKVQVKLPKDMLEKLVDEEPQKRKTTKRKKTKKSKGRRRRKK
jgi:hypothetical protein